MSLPRVRAAALAAGLAAGVWGCAEAPPQPAASKPRIAVLPFSNRSVDVLAPEKIRRETAEALKDRGYPLVEISTVDAALKGLGFSEGGQLGALSLEALRAAVPADEYLYGDVVDFGFKSAVALSQRKVELALRLVDSRTGAELFKGDEVGVTSKAGADAAGDLVLNVVGKVGKSIMGGSKKAADATDVVADVDLKQETREALRKLLDKFPR